MLLSLYSQKVISYKAWIELYSEIMLSNPWKFSRELASLCWIQHARQKW